MSSTTRSTPEPPSSEASRRAVIRSAAELNYTAQRVLRALEVLVFQPSTAPAVGEALGINARTARRILRTLANEGYVERASRARSRGTSIPANLATAYAGGATGAAPAARSAARRVVHGLEEETDAAAYIAVPSYVDVLVIAASGARGVRSWATLPAGTDAAGWVLLAYRDAWRDRLASAEPSLPVDDVIAAGIVERGYVELRRPSGRSSSLAVTVPSLPTPIAALGVRGLTGHVTDSPRATVEILKRAAARLADEITGA